METTHHFRLTPAARTVLLAGGAGLGGLLGAVFPRLAQWLFALPWFPWQGPVTLLSQLGSTVGNWVLIVLGALIGVGAGAFLAAHTPAITLSRSEVVVTEGGARTRLARSQVAVVLIEDKRLIMRDGADVELLRTSYEGRGSEILAVAEAAGWPVRQDA